MYELREIFWKGLKNLLQSYLTINKLNFFRTATHFIKLKLKVFCVASLPLLSFIKKIRKLAQYQKKLKKQKATLTVTIGYNDFKNLRMFGISFIKKPKCILPVIS